MTIINLSDELKALQEGRRNQIGVAHNTYQGKYKRVLAVCSAGVLRSPTIAYVLSQDPYNYNTRSVGITLEYALIPISHALLSWADEIVTVEDYHAKIVEHLLEKFELNNFTKKEVINLEIPDNFSYRQPELIDLIKERYPYKGI